MRQPLPCAALLFAFVSFEPLAAQDLAPSTAAGPPAIGAADAGLSLRGSPAGAALFAGREGVGLSSSRFIEEDGSRTLRQGLIGSWPLSSALHAGIGLFSVTADGRKQAEQRRVRNVRDVGTREERVAAIGLNLRF